MKCKTCHIEILELLNWHKSKECPHCQEYSNPKVRERKNWIYLFFEEYVDKKRMRLEDITEKYC